MDRLVAAMIALFAGLTLLPRYLSVEDANLQATIDADVATQFQTILQGATKYAAANADTLLGSIDSSAHLLPFTALAGYLPGGFSQKNVLGQTWQVYVRQPETGALQVLVEGIGGQKLSPKDLVKVSGLTGDLGGFVPYNGMLDNLSSSVAQGTNWSLPIASVPGLPSPDSGRLLGNALIGSATNTTIQTNDFLYRDAVPGHPELNRMDVALNMGGNNVNNAATVNAVQGVFSGNVTAANGTVSGNLTVGNQVTAGSAYVTGQATVGSNVTVASGGCAFNAPGTCLYGDGANSAIRTNGGVYFQNFAGSPADTSANHAVMQAAYLGTDNGTAITGNSCDHPAIAVSTDGSGTPLACINSIWSKIGGTTQTETSYENTSPNNGTGWPQVIVPNPITGGGWCPSGTTDYIAYQATDEVSNSWRYGMNSGNTTTVYYYHRCIVN